MRSLGLMDPAFLGGLGGLTGYDPDAAAYIAAVEAADGQALETGVRDAINAFVLGCKADGIWNAIKASCILAGARTLAGALVPLVGAAPTNFNFVAGDYNRKTGLVGNGSTKHLDSNRNNNADPQNSRHSSVFVSSSATRDSNRAMIGAGFSEAGSTGIISGVSPNLLIYRLSSSGASIVSSAELTPAFVGIARPDSAMALLRVNGATVTNLVETQAPVNQDIVIFGRNLAAQFNGRLAFYSIGESLDLSLFEARVTALINALAVAIP